MTSVYLVASPLRAEHWCELLQKNGDDLTSTATAYCKAISQHGPKVFQATLDMSWLRRNRVCEPLGWRFLIEALHGPVAKAAQSVAQACLATEPVSKITADSEARLRLKLQQLLPTADKTSSDSEDNKKTNSRQRARNPSPRVPQGMRKT